MHFLHLDIDTRRVDHTRRHLPSYLDRLRETGRSVWSGALVERYPEADPAF